MTLDLDLDAMTSDDRSQAEKILRRGLDLLKRGDDPDHAEPSTRTPPKNKLLSESENGSDA